MHIGFNRQFAGMMSLPVLLAAAPLHAAALIVDLELNEPTLDRWFYPFCCSFPTTGNEFESRIFSPLTETGFDPMFDNRDGQMLIAFDTAPDVPTGMGSNYSVTQAIITLTVSSDQTFAYDPTSDPFNSWLGEKDPNFAPDPDPGRAVELFGAGYRNGFTALSFPENGPYSPSGPFGQGTRNVFAFQFNQAGQTVDVSNNITGLLGPFNPVAWAVGQNASLTPGTLVPANTPLTFTINLSDPRIHEYLRNGLNSGRVAFMIASIFPAQQQVSGTFPKFYCMEHPSVAAGLVSAAQLDMTVIIGDVQPITGDLNQDGLVNGVDLGILLNSWSIPPGSPGCAGSLPCPADINGSGSVDGVDLGILLANWTM